VNPILIQNISGKHNTYLLRKTNIVTIRRVEFKFKIWVESRSVVVVYNVIECSSEKKKPRIHAIIWMNIMPSERKKQI